VLLNCARVSVDAATADRIRKVVRPDLDWAYLVRTASAHGTRPLLYRHLSRIVPETVPGAVLAALREAFLANARRNLLLTAELIRVLKSFDEHGVRAVPFKGPTLAACAYGNLALREFADLDLLVRAPEFSRAKELLIERRYRLGIGLSPAQEAEYLASIRQLPLLSTDGACMVELHSHVMPRHFYFPLDLDHLSGPLQTVQVSGRAVPTLPKEDLLLVLCAHGAKHRWGCLGWVCDVAELLRACPGMDWPRVEEQAGRLRSRRMLRLGLLLANDLLGAPLPCEVEREARADAVVNRLVARVSRTLLRAPADAPGGLALALFQIRARERLGDGVRYALSMALTPTVADWFSYRLPASISFFYYLLRPIRLVGKYFRRLTHFA
jgi:hypothetical protein